MQPRSIPLSRGMVALVDPVDFRRVIKHKWCLSPAGKHLYAATAMRVDGKRRMVRLHRFIMDATKDVYVDHTDGDGLNNTRENLRIATNSQNQMNRAVRGGGTSKFKGVTWHTARSKWAAQIHVNKKHIHLGLFTNEEEAARAYDRAAIEQFGEFARTNFSSE